MTRTFCVLVIEENPGLRDLFRVLFEGNLAFFPETATDAHRLLRDIHYDLLILDEDNGVLEHRWGIRARPRRPTLLIAPARPVDGLDASTSSLLVLPKPFVVEELLRFVKRIQAAWPAS